MAHRGQFPDNDFLKNKFHHDLGVLLNHCEAVSAARRSTREYSKRPSHAVHQGIIQTLNEFGKLTRYYNLDSLTGGKAAVSLEPVGAWWKRVGEPILSKHYTARQRTIDDTNAANLDELMREHVIVRHHSETGDAMNDVATVARRASETRVVQRYGRLYVLQIVRWLSYLISDLAQEAAYTNRIEPFRVRK
jgi:hypothetical protein